MKIVAINGSPRKNWNTATLLEKALDGAASQGAETELIHLYDLDFKGCVSCFACKIKGGKGYGRCVVKDDLAPVFKTLENADAILLGAPIYFGRVSGEMCSFLDRMLFQYVPYTSPLSSLFPKNIPVGFIYTMNVSEEVMKEMGFDRHITFNENILQVAFGSVETLLSFDTLQFEDYSKVDADFFDPLAKMRQHREVFPHDCQKALELGRRLVRG